MNYFPGIKIGDVVTLDGEAIEATAKVLGHDGYWFKNVGTTSYYHLRWYPVKEIEEFFHKGRLVFGNHPTPTGGSSGHTHSWVRYQGVMRVYDYCDCGAKKDVDWRTLGNTERKDKKGI